MSPVIRYATPADLPALIEIEQQSFANPHWGAQEFLDHNCLVAEIDGIITGLLVGRETFPGDGATPAEREILNLAVAPGFRRQGIATALLNHALSRKAIYFLEVRESNLAAQQLYRKFGFVEVGHRSNYYQSPPERAIVMKVNWC